MLSKSLFISRDYCPPQVGGITNLLFETARSLGAAEACYLTAVESSDRRDDSGLRIYRRPSAFSRSNIRQSLALLATGAEILVRERPTIAHACTVDDGYLAMWLRRVTGVPYLVYAHGNEVLDKSTAWNRSPQAMMQAACVVAVSKYTASLVELWGVDSERIKVVYPGCDISHFRPMKVASEARKEILRGKSADAVVLSIGGLVERKGQDMIIRALPALRREFPDIVYVVIGDGPDRARLEALAAEVGVADRVIFLGRISYDRLPVVIAVSDVFVMPSRVRPEHNDVEGFGLVYLEANACGKPVVGGRSGGIAEAIEENVTGLLADPNDPQDLARQLSGLLRDKDLARRLGEQGRQRVLRDFTWSRRATAIRDIIAAAERG